MADTKQTAHTPTPQKMRAALLHAIQRDHGYMEFCDGCTESKALLTLAVDSHEVLVGALKAAQERMSQWTRFMEWSDQDTLTMAKIGAALKQAGGE